MRAGSTDEAERDGWVAARGAEVRDSRYTRDLPDRLDAPVGVTRSATSAGRAMGAQTA